MSVSRVEINILSALCNNNWIDDFAMGFREAWGISVIKASHIGSICLHDQFTIKYSHNE